MVNDKEARSFINLFDLASPEIERIVESGVRAGRGAIYGSDLKGKHIGIMFSKTSTRTRLSFLVAAQSLGANVVNIQPEELQIQTGESLADTGKMLGIYLDCLVYRSNAPEAEMYQLAENGVTMINAMSAEQHPSQAVADFITLKQRFGELTGRHLLYVGEGNNTASALAALGARVPGLRMSFYMPKGYGFSEQFMRKLNIELNQNAPDIEVVSSLGELKNPVDVVYTSRWQTMGVRHEAADWKEMFAPFAVDKTLLNTIPRRKDGAVAIMHDLPAVEGEEIASGLLFGPESLAMQQAANKVAAAKAILMWTMSKAV